MAARVLREAHDDLREAVRHYRSVPPPKVGRQLAARVLEEFRRAVRAITAMPLACQEHPDIPGVRLVHFAAFPYLAFYLVDDAGEVVVIAVEHDASDYAAKVLRRSRGVP